MSKEKILKIVTIVLISFLILGNIPRLVPESKNYKVYEQALNEYSMNDYSHAYYHFGKISRFSKLKPAATFRQALCAGKLKQEKTEIKKYKEVIKKCPDSVLAIRAKYLKAQEYYESNNTKKAKKEFEKIIKKYPQTDYAVASEYYLGAIEAENASKIKNPDRRKKAKGEAISSFKTYLKEAPTGRLAINCIDKWLSLKTKLNNEDNLLIAKIYQENEMYAESLKHLKFTSLSVSWPYFVKNYYKLKDYSKVKYYTETGLKLKDSNDILINTDLNQEEENKNIYKAIDIYLQVSGSPKAALSYLSGIAAKSPGYEYLLYKKCNNLPLESQSACFNSLYYQFPKGQFAAESLANIFYTKIKLQQYAQARKLAKEHLTKFPDVNSTPRVIFWLAKIAERNKHYNEAKTYYRLLMRRFPDDYYAYRAFLNLNRYRPFRIKGISPKPVEFPYKDSGTKFIKTLAEVKDYGLIHQLYPENDFIQSWIAYKEGDYSRSSRLARDAMEKIEVKPDRNDPRWKLVYPVLYYNPIKESSYRWGNDPLIILSIIREESYFNPKAQSAVGARGLMQLMPATADEAARRAGITLPTYNMLFNPELNINLGNAYYSRLKKDLLYKDILAVLAYNGGIGSVSSWKQNLYYEDIDDFVEQIPYPETQNYLKKVYKSYWNYLRIYTNIGF